MNTKLKQIYNLCPTLAYMEFDACHSALVRMCIAHQLNGGEFGGLYETALEYLQNTFTEKEDEKQFIRINQ